MYKQGIVLPDRAFVLQLNQILQIYAQTGDLEIYLEQSGTLSTAIGLKETKECDLGYMLPIS